MSSPSSSSSSTSSTDASGALQLPFSGGSWPGLGPLAGSSSSPIPPRPLIAVEPNAQDAEAIKWKNVPQVKYPDWTARFNGDEREDYDHDDNYKEHEYDRAEQETTTLILNHALDKLVKCADHVLKTHKKLGDDVEWTTKLVSDLCCVLYPVIEKYVGYSGGKVKFERNMTLAIVAYVAAVRKHFFELE